ncbi:Nitroreductase isoform B [Micractinium conductrix]|nr:Nitroreductase isoform B [Micractinium conductrix]|eukprot:PSC72958.1 Nitroreductase isoform B [Micractinium conductrix]
MDPGRPLDPSALSLLLEAASWAPSHGRTDPWSFVVFQSPQALEALAHVSVSVLRREEGPRAAADAQEEFAPGKRWANAACLIAVCMRRRPRCCTPGGAARFNPEWEEVAAVACAVQNMHLMATALPGGVCGYWSSWYESVRDAPEMRVLLGLSEGDRCLGFFVVGHCDRVGEFRASRDAPSCHQWP